MRIMTFYRYQLMPVSRHRLFRRAYWTAISAEVAHVMDSLCGGA